MSEKTLSLKSLISSTKEVTIDYPGFEGFKVNLSFLSREDLVKIRKKATAVHMKKGAPVETINDELFLALYVKAAIKGWDGLKLKYVEQLAPIDIDESNYEVILPYTEENALMLMQKSSDFDSFVSEAVTDLSNFSKNSGKN